MKVLKQLAVALCLFSGMHGVVYAQQKNSESLGELLYATHCHACHTAEIHWRKQRLATDWNSLVVQVRRWQINSGLGWSDEEIADVARYLNAAYYGFPVTDQKGFLQGKRPSQDLRQY